MPDFSFDALKKELKGEAGDWGDVWYAFDSYNKSLKREGRIKCYIDESG